MQKSHRKYQLKYFGLPVIQSLEQFSEKIRISEPTLEKYINFANHYYYTYELPKKSGGTRLIAQPCKDLKAIQVWILRHILDKLSTSEASKGFEKGTSIYDNASPHIGANVILTLDIENFFPSILANKIYTIFYSLGYPQHISSALANICTYKGFLPQGSPASPKLANLVCLRLDARIQGYAGKKGITYTRYADDMTLSCRSINKLCKAKHFVQTIIGEEDFKLNNKKTKLLGLRKKKTVTGLVVNSNKVGVGIEVYRTMRAKIHHIALDKNYDYESVNGWLSFIRSVDHEIYKRLTNYISKLSSRYPNSANINNLYIKELE